MGEGHFRNSNKRNLEAKAATHSRVDMAVISMVLSSPNSQDTDLVAMADLDVPTATIP